MRCSNKMFQEPKATELEQMRAQRRSEGRIVYDCLSAQVENDHTVSCPNAWGNNAVSLLTVLRGCTMPQKKCIKCPNYRSDLWAEED